MLVVSNQTARWQRNGNLRFYFREKRGPSSFHEQIVDACVHLCMLAIEREESREQIAKLVHFDSLTGAPNRTHLCQHIDRLLAAGEHKNIAFFSLDIGHFRDVNDTLGYSAGDKVLIEVANRLKELLGATAFISRSGGDCFVIVFSGCDVQHAATIAIRIRDKLKAPIDDSGFPLYISVNIGISLYPENGKTRDTLLKHANTAMYRVKESGRGGYLFFSPKMNRIAHDRLVLGMALKLAIANQHLRLHYQPQMRLENSELYGVEALARWRDPDLGEISPGKFIPLAEEIGEIEAIGLWSLREACRQMAEWRSNAIRVPVVSVNLSPIHFCNRELPDCISSLLREYALSPSCLTVEITESVMMDQRLEMLETMHALRALGVGLSLDDFGTGFSSLSRLAHLPVTELKIDRSFMQDFKEDSNTQAFATAVIRIGQSLHLTVVAEGVETEPQRRLLRDLHCDIAQGFLYSKALDPANLAKLDPDGNR